MADNGTTLHAACGGSDNMTTNSRRQLKLGAYISPGGHQGGWRHPDAVPNALMDFELMSHVTRVAEGGKMHAVFFPDSCGMAGATSFDRGDLSRARRGRCVYIEPATLLAGLAARTSHIGLIATITTTYNEPFHVARRFASIDHISGGRAGWNLVTSQIEDESWNFGREQHVDHALRYERAAEFIDVVMGLWDSWEDDAFVLDKEGGQYFDPAKLHFVRHKGAHFDVRGPLNVERSPQGRPVVAQAGTSEVGRDLAARTADLVFTAQLSLEDAREFYADVKARVAAYGRGPEEVSILPGLTPIVGRTQSEAEDKYHALQDMLPDELAVKALERLTGDVDLMKCDFDGPLPPLPPSNSARGRQKMIVDQSDKGMTIRQIARHYAVGSGHLATWGTPSQIADMMQEWLETRGCDGFNVMTPYLPGPLEEFVELVIPELQRRGLFQTEYEGRTLRENLGLQAPRNRFAA
jgi:FMN-dependent oxidoreductase (nitrilotriacetate monooxygenase family)